MSSWGQEDRWYARGSSRKQFKYQDFIFRVAISEGSEKQFKNGSQKPLLQANVIYIIKCYCMSINNTEITTKKCCNWRHHYLFKTCYWSHSMANQYEMLVLIMSHTTLEWIYILLLFKCQITPCSKQARYLKLKGLKRDSNPIT